MSDPTIKLTYEASRVIYRAERLRKDGDFSGCLEQAQHAIELYVKVLFRLVNMEPPYIHDAGKELPHVLDRLDFTGTGNELLVALGRIRWISQMWEFANTTAVYGYGSVGASRLFNDKDAEIAMGYANEVHSATILVSNSVLQRRIRVKTETKKKGG